MSSEILQRLEFVARAFDYPLKFHYEVAINRVVACMEGLNRLLAAGDQNSKQRDFLLLGRDEGALAAYAASETCPAPGARGRLHPPYPRRSPAAAIATAH